MRAIVCREFAAPDTLRVTTVADPVPGPGQVLLRVAATGLGYVDALTVAGLYQIKPGLPFIPGNEMAGQVLALGPGVASVAAGARVICVGARGGLAEAAVVPADSLYPIPDSLSTLDAASFVVNYCTALHGLANDGQLRAGEWVLVLGASGGVGAAAVDVARAMNARVIAAASTEAKRQACLRLGADAVVDYSRPDWRQDLRAITGSGQVDVVYDPVGGDFAEPALRSLAPGGRFLVVGFAAGPIPRIPLNLPLLKRCAIVGVNWGASVAARPALAPEVMGRLLDWIRDGAIHPRPGAVYPLDEAGAAMAAMLNRQTIGKVVIRIDPRAA
jgi:NADPH2:quinone reductase